MSFFIDANVILYATSRDERAEGSRRVLEAVARGDAVGRTSVAVLEEVWHLELSGRIEGIEGLTMRAYDLLNPLLSVTDEALRLAFELPPMTDLGANDRLHAGTCLKHGLPTIVSADRGFDDLRSPARVDPLDEARLSELLAGD